MLTLSRKNRIVNNSSSTSGYSLIELVVTIALTSLVVVVFLSFFSSIQLQSTEPVFQVKAAELGQAYLEEISLKKYDHNSPNGNGNRCNDSGPACSATLTSEGGETRITYNDVDDYHNLSDSPPQDALGNVRSGFNNFSVDIQVSYAGADLGLAAQDLKRIEVIVTTPDGTQFPFSQYRGNF